MKLAEFNSADPAAAQAILRPCIDVSRWVEAVAGARPYANRDGLLAFAAKAASPFTPAEVEAAMTHHPRIGERPTTAGTEASMSRSEQAGVDPADTAVADALARGNREYEDKFGRVFLIRAAGRSAQDILAALDQRLTNSAEEEDRIVAQQLREIAVLRLEGVISE
ncbi:2-oxo-4-hydroxy-4-carboxy-5-ureidoimidazoline decarboxylase [Arthrobacter sp. NicSoilC5]|uniref:2-oxo-4-hydroxy-4-carboxy-5-ureidoimidazoline decarboxylase n=1 Tax=Arthrobacter sp. NicSoilC5 TaxID=2831000 RepID=UPI001CC47F13|nr:2-oxo-4-hydroxy-4-carboxy-5-ureidoimidazoline decarboxylase [Arthrobacter sp. NicSoilC5]BCW80298.1 OHCU decarboxylase [Arthrobacter sp. NicSoilC5]